MTTDKEHLQWIHDRIVEVYGENENIDFLHRMRNIIDKQDTELNLHGVSKSLYSDDAIIRLKAEYFEKGLRANT